MVLFSSIFYCG